MRSQQVHFLRTPVEWEALKGQLLYLQQSVHLVYWQESGFEVSMSSSVVEFPAKGVCLNFRQPKLLRVSWTQVVWIAKNL